MVCFLSLAMWGVLEQWMHGKGLGTCARRLIDEISTIKSMDVVVPVKQGERVTEVTVRTVGKPERRVAELLTRLDLRLPKGNQILGGAVCRPQAQPDPEREPVKMKCRKSRLERPCP